MSAERNALLDVLRQSRFFTAARCQHADTRKNNQCALRRPIPNGVVWMGMPSLVLWLGPSADAARSIHIPVNGEPKSDEAFHPVVAEAAEGPESGESAPAVARTPEGRRKSSSGQPRRAARAI